jgi:cytidyltransferase-like protein
MNKKPKKVFVSGCYDMLHSGHIAFFEEAAQHGDLYVGIGSDKTIFELKNRTPVNPEQERLYMVKALKSVKDAWVNTGNGIIDFEEEVKKLSPDIFFVNTDGHTPAKEFFCGKFGIEYVVSNRIPHEGLPSRSTTAIRQECRIPYRIDLAGGWIDQPYVNKYSKGSVITISIEPDYEFNDRSGMATSSRKKAVELWHTDIPEGNIEKLAKTLFCFENPPGTKYISGSQDSIGIVYPGLNKINYDKEAYWPSNVDSVDDNRVLDWMEKHIWLIPLYPRLDSYDVFTDANINEECAIALCNAADECWHSFLIMDAAGAGKAMIKSFEAQIAMFPNMVSKDIMAQVDKYKSDVLGWKVSGAGGGGYLIFFSENPVENSIKIRIRR